MIVRSGSIGNCTRPCTKGRNLATAELGLGGRQLQTDRNRRDEDQRVVAHTWIEARPRRKCAERTALDVLDVSDHADRERRNPILRSGGFGVRGRDQEAERAREPPAERLDTTSGSRSLVSLDAHSGCSPVRMRALRRASERLRDMLLLFRRKPLGDARCFEGLA